MSVVPELKFYRIEERTLVYITGSFRLVAYIDGPGILFYPPITFSQKSEVYRYKDLLKI